MEKSRKSRFVSILLIGLLGIIFLFLGENYLEDVWLAIFRSLGTTLVSIALVSFFYAWLVAESHFKEFRQQLTAVVDESDSLYSSCHKLGIRGIYENRKDYEGQHNLTSVIADIEDNTIVLCVGRTLFHLLNHKEELKEGLEKGLNFQFACYDPNKINTLLKKTTFTRTSDLASTLCELQDLISWAKQAKPRGSIELRYHEAGVIDTIMAYHLKTGENIVLWDLSFGRDIQDKMVFHLNATDKSLGNKLKGRYETIYKYAESQVLYSANDTGYFKPILDENTTD